jgi:hypothetical protein
MRDNASKLGQVLYGPAAAVLPAWTASWTGQAIDLQAMPGFNAAALYIIAGTWTDGTHAFTVQEAPDNGSGSPGTYTNVAATDLGRLQTANASGGLPITLSAAGSQPASISSAPTALNQRVGYVGDYPSTGATRFLRVIGTVSGATTGAKYLPIWVLGEPRVFPAAV